MMTDVFKTFKVKDTHLLNFSLRDYCVSANGFKFTDRLIFHLLC